MQNEIVLWNYFPYLICMCFSEYIHIWKVYLKLKDYYICHYCGEWLTSLVTVLKIKPHNKVLRNKSILLYPTSPILATCVPHHLNVSSPLPIGCLLSLSYHSLLPPPLSLTRHSPYSAAAPHAPEFPVAADHQTSPQHTTLYLRSGRELMILLIYFDKGTVVLHYIHVL